MLELCKPDDFNTGDQQATSRVDRGIEDVEYLTTSRHESLDNIYSSKEHSNAAENDIDYWGCQCIADMYGLA